MTDESAAPAPESAPPLEVILVPNGPVRVNGRVAVVFADGRAFHEELAVFCRCGHSRKKPFCDGSHRAAGFRAD